LITRGRKSGKPRRVTIWISTDAKRLYVRSGAGMRRDWPQNLLAAGEGELQVGGRKVKVRPRHVTQASEARAASELHRAKYGSYVKPSRPPEPLTTGEQATFELLPAD
ncbi:MAG TPA: nitroreductase family deazaflavin-dependent oxidoreductase, partial [Candidatus Dormibacteraeota bacterium]|nr:nitroreductase family deazaflavin-dependent oxidoreductase [Candidatus Dormibacteraeota bacterium]